MGRGTKKRGARACFKRPPSSVLIFMITHTTPRRARKTKIKLLRPVVYVQIRPTQGDFVQTHFAKYAAFRKQTVRDTGNRGTPNHSHKCTLTFSDNPVYPVRTYEVAPPRSLRLYARGFQTTLSDSAGQTQTPACRPAHYNSHCELK